MRNKALWIAYKLLDMPSPQWRRVNTLEFTQVLPGEKSVDGLAETNVGNAA